MEIFKIINEHPEYAVSNLGQVKSLKYGKERILKPGTDKNGYLHVVFSIDGILNIKKVHHLVAMVFLDHKKSGFKLVVNHKNINKKDNRLCNLEIVTQRENTNHKHIISSSKYTGVSWNKKNSKWISNIYINKKLKYLGSFENELDAYKAYQDELLLINS